MRSRLITAAGLLLCSGLAAASDPDQQSSIEVAKDRRFVVGQIFISGNTATPHWFILSRLGLYSAQRARYSQLRDAEDTLERLHVFGSIRVTIMPDDKPGSDSIAIQDLMVEITEKRFSGLAWLVIDGLIWLGAMEGE